MNKFEIRGYTKKELASAIFPTPRPTRPSTISWPGSTGARRCKRLSETRATRKALNGCHHARSG